MCPAFKASPAQTLLSILDLNTKHIVNAGPRGPHLWHQNIFLSHLQPVALFSAFELNCSESLGPINLEKHSIAFFFSFGQRSYGRNQEIKSMIEESQGIENICCLATLPHFKI